MEADAILTRITQLPLGEHQMQFRLLGFFGVVFGSNPHVNQTLSELRLEPDFRLRGYDQPLLYELVDFFIKSRRVATGSAAAVDLAVDDVRRHATTHIPLKPLF